MPKLTKLVTMEEASQHNTKDDCWVVIDEKVYDLSSYLDEHPGGDDVVLAATGMQLRILKMLDIAKVQRSSWRAFALASLTALLSRNLKLSPRSNQEIMLRSW